ncbi:MAG: hypothetical protein CVU84_07950 [Firmicutes bacterium HGW-Firmicutes-1]|jgi:spore germination protein KC|nr:MAG: hypothetical protein CVU84_07950 [Firmicutes bacterium HGW-Firmicutes-1]
MLNKEVRVLEKRKYTFFRLIFGAEILLITFTGCWNYREVEKLGIVAGVAIDYNKETKKYLVTTEILDIKGGKENTTNTQIISTEGDTIFDAIRNLLQDPGRKLYFSHTKVLIISKDIAESGILSVIDVMNRQEETRHDIDILISSDKASEVFACKKNASEILSYKISDTLLVSQENLPIAPKVDLWQFINQVSAEDEAGILPIIHEVYEKDNVKLEISGAGIFKGQKLIGYLNGEDAHMLLFVRDEIKDGLLVIEDLYEDKKTKVTLELLNNKTKITPYYSEDKLIMKINIKSEAVLGENMGLEDFSSEEGMKKLKNVAEKKIKNEVTELINKVQKQSGSDVFKFGKAIRVKRPDLWEQFNKNWDAIFLLVEIDVDVDMQIKNSGIQGKPIKVGY